MTQKWCLRLQVGDIQRWCLQLQVSDIQKRGFVYNYIYVTFKGGVVYCLMTYKGGVVQQHGRGVGAAVEHVQHAIFVQVQKAVSCTTDRHPHGHSGSLWFTNGKQLDSQEGLHDNYVCRIRTLNFQYSVKVDHSVSGHLPSSLNEDYPLTKHSHEQSSKPSPTREEKNIRFSELLTDN